MDIDKEFVMDLDKQTEMIIFNSLYSPLLKRILFFEAA